MTGQIMGSCGEHSMLGCVLIEDAFGSLRHAFNHSRKGSGCVEIGNPADFLPAQGAPGMLLAVAWASPTVSYPNLDS